MAPPTTNLQINPTDETIRLGPLAVHVTVDRIDLGDLYSANVVDAGGLATMATARVVVSHDQRK